jgi:hypothetical protein
LVFALTALIGLTLAFYAKGFVRVSVVQMAMAIISSLALAGILMQPIQGRGVIGRWMIGAALLTAFAYTLFWFYTGISEASRNVAWAANPASWALSDREVPPEAGTCRAPAGMERTACFGITAADAETIHYVQQRTTPDDPVFVGLSRHDRIFVNNVLLYFVMNRKPATKWYQFDPGLQTSEPIQREMVGELRQAKPKLIVIDHDWADWREPNASTIPSGVTVLDDYIKRAFEPVATFGVNTVMRPRSPEQP